jgi:hypothetical protein
MFASVLTSEQVQQVTALSAVSKGLEQLQSFEHSQYPIASHFRVVLSDEIKTSIQTAMSIDLSNVREVPMKWIKGDVPAHAVENATDDAYLLFLSSTDGQFTCGDLTCPIQAGSGVRFARAVSHQTLGTNNVPRLVIGPINQTGVIIDI